MSVIYLRQAGRLVREALESDKPENLKDAYIKYLGCIHFISSHLITAGFPPDPGSAKLVQLLQQCTERLSGMTKDLPEQAHSSMLQTVAGMENCYAKSNIQQTTSTSNSAPHVEAALQQNKKILEAYNARMRTARSTGTLKTDRSLTMQRKLAENLAIAQSRDEALKKKILERKMIYEREAAKRISMGVSPEEQERRRIFALILEYEDAQIWTKEYRKMLAENPSNGAIIQEFMKKILNTREHPIAQLLVKYQYSVYNKLRPIVEKYMRDLTHIQVPYCPSSPSRTKAPSSLPESPARDVSAKFALPDICRQVQGDVTKALTLNQTLAKQLNEETRKTRHMLEQMKNVIAEDVMLEEMFDDDLDVTAAVDEGDLERLEQEALQRHLEQMVQDIREHVDKVLAMVSLAYEQLVNAAARDICYSAVEQAFFSQLWGYVLTVFRLVNRQREEKLAQVMTSYKDAMPSSLNIAPELWLEDPQVLPYQLVIDELKVLPQFSCPLDKLENVVRAVKFVCESVERHYAAKGETAPAIGADELVPILCYCSARTATPQLISELHALEEFIHEGYLMGEEGYCLTSFQTSLHFLTSQSSTAS